MGVVFGRCNNMPERHEWIVCVRDNVLEGVQTNIDAQVNIGTLKNLRVKNVKFKKVDKDQNQVVLEIFQLDRVPL